MHSRVDHSVPGINTARPLVLDLVDEDHRVADDHAGKRDDAEDCDEAHRRAGRQKRGDDADETERRHADHHGHPAEATELDDERGEHEGDHERKLGEESGVALCALLNCAAGLDQGACGHRLAQLLDRSGNLLVDEGRLQSRQRLRLHGDGRQAAAAPDIALVEIILELG